MKKEHLEQTSSNKRHRNNNSVPHQGCFHCIPRHAPAVKGVIEAVVAIICASCKRQWQRLTAYHNSHIYQIASSPLPNIFPSTLPSIRQEKHRHHPKIRHGYRQDEVVTSKGLYPHRHPARPKPRPYCRRLPSAPSSLPPLNPPPIYEP